VVIWTRWLLFDPECAPSSPARDTRRSGEQKKQRNDEVVDWEEAQTGRNNEGIWRLS
jgi:hypothetical protein